MHEINAGPDESSRPALYCLENSSAALLAMDKQTPERLALLTQLGEVAKVPPAMILMWSLRRANSATDEIFKGVVRAEYLRLCENPHKSEAVQQEDRILSDRVAEGALQLQSM